MWWLEEGDALEEEEKEQPIILLVLSLTGCLCAYPRFAKLDVGYYRRSGKITFDEDGHFRLARRFMGMNDSEFDTTTP